MPEEMLCPSCGQFSPHSEIKGGQKNLVRCQQCGDTHLVVREKPRLKTVRAIISTGATSCTYHIDLPSRDLLHVGQELVVDDGKSDVVISEITSLETDRRVIEAEAREVTTVWARAVDQVEVKIAVYHRGKTKSFKELVLGERIFSVGESGRAEGAGYRIVKIKSRDGTFPSQARARDIVRIWGRRD